VKANFVRYPSPAASRHPLPLGEGFARDTFLTWITLDHLMFFYGSNMSNSGQHSSYPLQDHSYSNFLRR
jgi:hypothetical protein